MNDEPTMAENDPPAPFPGAFEICRARPSGFAVNQILCICRPPIPCPYRKVYGENYFCFHSNRDAIVDRTREVIPPPA